MSGLGGLCSGRCRRGMHLGEPLFSPLMRILLGSCHIISAFLHHPLEGGDLHSRANPGVDAIQLLTVCPGILVRHVQLLGSTWGEKHTLSQANYYYSIRDANGSLKEIF